MNSIFKQLPLHKRCIICSFTSFLVSIYAAKFYFDFIEKNKCKHNYGFAVFLSQISSHNKTRNMQEEALRYALNDRMIGLSEL